MHNHFLDKKRRHINLRDAKVEGVLPEHFDTSYPKFISLLEKYYDFMDSDRSTELLSHLFAARDVNETDITLLSYIEDELLLGEAYFEGFGETESQKRAAANFSNILFRSKGTKFAIEWFFRSFYGLDSEVVYPKENIFNVGDLNSRVGPESLRFITDDKLYQTFALLVRVGIPVSKWRDTFKLFAHPAGMYLGAEVLIDEEVVLGVNTLMDALSVQQYATPEYSMTVSPSDSEREGTEFTLNVIGTDIPSGTSALYYYIEHQSTSDSDFVTPPPDSSTAAYLPITGSTGSFTVATKVDTNEAEGQESFFVRLKDDEGREKASKIIRLEDVISSYVLSPDPTTAIEGQVQTFNVQGTGVPNDGNTTLFYYVSHGTTNDSDFTVAPPTSSSALPFDIINNNGSFTLQTIVDPVVKGTAENFTVGIQTEPNGGIVKNTVSVDIQETAPTFDVTANDIVEGEDIVVNLNVDSSTVGQPVSWTVSADSRFASTSGSFTIASANQNYTLSGTSVSSAFEGSLNKTLTVTTDKLYLGGTVPFTDNDTFAITDAPAVYSITPSPSIGSEGTTTTFNIGGTNIPDVPVDFYIEHGTTNNADFSITPPLVSSKQPVTISGGTGSATLTFSSNNDLTEEEFTVIIEENLVEVARLEYSILGTLVYTLTPDTTSIDETTALNNLDTTFSTTDSDGTYYYYVSGAGIDADDFDAGYGSQTSRQPFTVTSGTGEITLNLDNDKKREGEESFVISVSKTPTGAVISQSPSITIADTSVPTYSVSSGNSAEGSIHTVIITPDGNSTEDLHVAITGAGVVGRFPITEKTVSVSHTAAFTPVYFDTTLDPAYNGAQTGTVTARFDSASGTIVGTDTFIFNDATPTYSLTTDLTNDSANEGDTINFTFSGTNIEDKSYVYRPVNVYPVETDQPIAQGTSFIYLKNTSGLAVGMESNFADVPGTITSVVSSGVQMSQGVPLTTIPSGTRFHFSAQGNFDDFQTGWPATGAFATSSNSGTFEVRVAENSDINDESYTFGVYDSHNASGFGTDLALKTVSINDTSSGDQVILSNKPSLVQRTVFGASVTTQVEFRPDGTYWVSYPTITSTGPTFNGNTYFMAENIGSGYYIIEIMWEGERVYYETLQTAGVPVSITDENRNIWYRGTQQSADLYAVTRTTTGVYQLGTWLNPTTTLPSSASNYMIQVNKSGEFGNPTFIGSFGTPLSLNTNRIWKTTVFDNNGTAGASFSFEVYETSSSSNSDTWYATVQATETYTAPPPGGEGQCLLEGTCILTEKGLINIEDLSVGDKVISSSGEENVVKSINSFEVDRIYTINEDLICMTSSHLLMTSNGWAAIDPEEAIKAQEEEMTVLKLTEDMTLLKYENEPEKIENISKVDTVCSVYTIKLDGDRTYIANGIITHNK